MIRPPTERTEPTETKPKAMLESSYHPIDCAVHDRLESWAVRRVQVAVRFSDAEGEEHRERSVIQDIRVRGGEEFAVLESGSRIRLDRILEIRPD